MSPPPPHPFGTGNLGLSLTSVIGADADHTIETFVAAVQQSTKLTPVWDWLSGFAANPARRELAKDIALGLLIAVLPALAAGGGVALCAEPAARRRGRPRRRGAAAAAPPHRPRRRRGGRD